MNWIQLYQPVKEHDATFLLHIVVCISWASDLLLLSMQHHPSLLSSQTLKTSTSPTLKKKATSNCFYIYVSMCINTFCFLTYDVPNKRARQWQYVISCLKIIVNGPVLFLKLWSQALCFYIDIISIWWWSWVLKN